MKKIIYIALLIVICMSTTNAQIKIVGDDYAAIMTGSKEYYDRDVDFDKIFPREENDGCLYPLFNRFTNKLNRLGDTVYLPKSLSERPQQRLSEQFIYIFEGTDRISKAPIGYYTIEEYIFCTDNADTIASSLGLDLGFVDYEKRTTKSLKEDLLQKGEGFTKNELTKYMVFYILKSTTDNIFIYAHPNISDLEVCLVPFYNEAAKFIGNEVVLTSGYHMAWDVKCFYTSPFPKEGAYHNYTYETLNIVRDALTQNLVRLEDAKYEVTDIVLKDGVFYAVFTGIKTGTFSMKINRILYAYSAEDIDENYFNLPGNNNGDVACMEFECPGPSINDHCNGIIYVMMSDQIELLERRSKMAKAQQEQESKKRKLQSDKEREKQETAFVNKMVAKYGDTLGPIIGKKQVSIGMTEEMCHDAWGKPMNTYRTTTKYGQSEVWCYNYKTRIYFFEGKVVQIDN